MMRAGPQRLAQQPYTVEQWQEVRGGWWSHALITVLTGWIAGLYPIYVLTEWQKVGGDPLILRVCRAIGCTLLLFVPFLWGIAIPWTRRWYFLYQQDAEAKLVANLIEMAEAENDDSVGVV